MKSAPQAVELQLGTGVRKSARGAFKPKAEAVADAQRKYAAALAALKVAFTGRDLGADAGVRLVRSVRSLETALAVYVTVTHLGVSKKVLAVALGTLRAVDVRRYCAFVEHWREAPVASDALARVEAALPRGL